LIAGSYTPFCLVTLNNTVVGWTIFGIIWGIAVLGIALQAVYINLPRWLTTSLYIAMGWMVVIGIKPFLARMAPPGMLLLAIGGIIYTIGGVIYTIKKPNISKQFDYHSLWHVMVLLGAICHYFVMLFFVKL
jgi:hemolysin III